MLEELFLLNDEYHKKDNEIDKLLKRDFVEYQAQSNYLLLFRCLCHEIETVKSDLKTNIDPVFLNTLITCRHYHINLIYSRQAFNLVDALLRTVTQTCIWVNKEWRFLVEHLYDAHQMEYATNPNLLRPIRRTGFFITNKDYNAYDTLATVNELKKKVDNKDMMTEEEILQLRGEINPNMEGVLAPSRKYKRLHKKLKS